jgi:integrase
MAGKDSENGGKKDASQQSAGRNLFRLFKVTASPYFQVRLMLSGKRRQFSTGETSQKAAKAKARAILADIQSRGFEAAVAMHTKKTDALGPDPTVEKITKLYSAAVKNFESSPSDSTVRVYTNNLKLIAKFCGEKKISGLTQVTIDRGKRKYLAQCTSEGRAAESARITLASILRNAAAVFSKQALAVYQEAGLTIENPFSGSKLKGVQIKPYTPLPRKVLETIWENSTLLRDGNPDAPLPDKATNEQQKADFRLPHPDAYAILFLEIGLGLRRNEADKAEWSWCYQTQDGRRFLEVQNTDVFTPKSKSSRTIPIAKDVWEALESVAAEGSRFIVPASSIRSRPAPRARYRCNSAHQVLVEWLRNQGVNSAKPCHALRKEFGSYVATSFSLFHAQKLLGHSSPTVTSDYYAGLTGLPELNPFAKTPTTTADEDSQPNIPE